MKYGYAPADVDELPLAWVAALTPHLAALAQNGWNTGFFDGSPIAFSELVGEEAGGDPVMMTDEQGAAMFEDLEVRGG